MTYIESKLSRLEDIATEETKNKENKQEKNFYMKNKGENNLLFVYKFYSDIFPRSKKLNMVL